MLQETSLTHLLLGHVASGQNDAQASLSSLGRKPATEALTGPDIGLPSLLGPHPTAG